MCVYVCEYVWMCVDVCICACVCVCVSVHVGLLVITATKGREGSERTLSGEMSLLCRDKGLSSGSKARGGNQLAHKLALELMPPMLVPETAPRLVCGNQAESSCRAFDPPRRL